MTLNDIPPDHYKQASYLPTDIDECTDSAVCDHGSCTNTVGGFVCQCDNGFTPSVNRRKCLGMFLFAAICHI